MNKNQIIVLFLVWYSLPAWASYTIKGKVNMNGDWQQQIYLSTIDRLDDYYSGNAEFIINIAPIDKNGEFTITGDNLPNYPNREQLKAALEN